MWQQEKKSIKIFLPDATPACTNMEVSPTFPCFSKKMFQLKIKNASRFLRCYQLEFVRPTVVASCCASNETHTYYIHLLRMKLEAYPFQHRGALKKPFKISWKWTVYRFKNSRWLATKGEWNMAGLTSLVRGVCQRPKKSAGVLYPKKCIGNRRHVNLSIIGSLTANPPAALALSIILIIIFMSRWYKP